MESLEGSPFFVGRMTQQADQEVDRSINKFEERLSGYLNAKIDPSHPFGPKLNCSEDNSDEETDANLYQRNIS